MPRPSASPREVALALVLSFFAGFALEFLR